MWSDIDLGGMTALIGRNDSGKSTIMEALDLFLSDSDPDKDDASKTGNAKDLALICEFNDLPSEIVVDDASPTSLQAEFLLNLAGDLEIHKTYSGHLQKPKCTSIEAYAHHPNAEQLRNLLQLKNPDLKKCAEQLGVDLTNVDQQVNAQIRKRIREHVGILDLQMRKIPLNEENGRKIWDELRKYLHSFSLFKSDRPSSDQDPEAQDPLKTAIKEALKAKEAELLAITEHVRTEVQNIANSTLEKLREMDPSLANELRPTFAPPKWDTLFKASLTSDGDIPINKRGSGVKRLILLNFFRAKAEQLARQANRTCLIYAVEEPETSQHPNNQRMLLRALSDLSSEAQVIISTHTPMLARGLPDDTLRYIHVRPDNVREILKGGPETNSQFAQSLGVLPDNRVKLFICVEGPNDIAFLQGISRALRGDDDVEQRFKREGIRGAHLRDANLIDVIAYEDNQDGHCFESKRIENPFIVMEFIRGGTLESLIKKIGASGPGKTYVTKQTLYIASCISNALRYLHDKKIIHRDVKPANVFLSPTATGELPQVVKLGDFGVTKWGDFLATAASGTLTVTKQQGLGTLKYMSPEQAVRPKEVTVRSDMFSLGITLFELFTGQILSSPHHVFEIMSARTNRESIIGKMNALGIKCPYEEVNLFQVILDMFLIAPKNRPTSKNVAGRMEYYLERKDVL